MAELVKIKEIPAGKQRGTQYPWAKWEKLLKNGRALKLGREDMPEDSFAYRHWDTKRVVMTSSAKVRNLHIARRGDYIYLWRK